MSIDETLLQAILAMDSYNRKTGGLQLGTQSIGPYSYVDSIEAGAFAATAYRLDSDESILISYRGTDNPLVNALNGYGIARGSPYGDEARVALH
jgi:hypothetical protein